MTKKREIKDSDFKEGDQVLVNMDHGPDSGWHKHKGFIVHVDKYNPIGIEIVILYKDSRGYNGGVLYYIFNDYSLYDVAIMNNITYSPHK